MCVLYVSFGCKVRPITFGCVAMGSVVYYFLVALVLVCTCDGDVICVGHYLNWCSGWWYVCSVNVE